ncbi:MAG: protein translocase subunit SecF [Synergistaceae bacterium]|nr:protein translocase subunit SecF [Synergistaceae bacterium]MBQ3625285.1 protein translocase subunit SecF [Synergistaceae bacterium]MBQ9580912.1 protein translocase subunit SecF [Synergistaceae bacterium]MBQ9897781.1 protein translocase subunit SecF [Synergistaceae bacterium]MBR0044338.1 protein translocase subunit SecF [Synergistaceae bacterium]
MKNNFNFKFMSFRRPALCISLILVLISFGFLFTRGLNLGIDFTGGNVIQAEFAGELPDIAKVREVVSAVVAKGAMIQNFGEKGIIIRTNEDTDESRQQVVDVLNKNFTGMTITGFEKVGPVIGGELRQQAFIGVTIALIAILIYITLRFQFRFAVVSVVPLVHDVIIALGFFSITQMEISSSFIAAILTIVGYSLNNTIIILDRIRENWRDLSHEGIAELVNKSVNQTLARTINTTLTTLFPVIALCVWGGPVLQAFSYAMLVGIIAGTWSSMFVATGFLIEWYLAKPEGKAKR